MHSLSAGYFSCLLCVTVCGTGAPNFFSLGVSPPPTSVPNFRLRQGVGEGEFFEYSQTCQLELEDQNGCVSPGKLMSDIDLILAPYCPQMVRNPYTGVHFSIFAPNSAGGAPKLDRSLLPVAADFAISSCHPLTGH